MRNPFKRRESAFKDYSGLIRGVRTRHKKHMQHWWQWAILGVVLVVLLAGGAGGWYYFTLLDDIQDPDLGAVESAEGQEPYNALLVGSDSRKGLTEQEQQDLGADPVEDERADTLIIAHIDPDQRRVTMVQFPRDLYVPILDEGRARINSALENGRNHLVLAVEDLTGLEINRYAQVNIAGFRDLVDAIGGVEVCITEPIPFDDNTGFGIARDELGLVSFDGAEALRFVRTRKTLPRGDFDRIQNQQKFLAAALDKVLSVPTLLRPDRLLDLKRIAGDNVRIDEGTTLFDLRRLAEQVRSLDPERYEAYTVPNKGPTMVGEASVVAPDPAAMRVLFDAIADDESPAEADGVPSVRPASVRVGVYNASGREDAAARAATRLRAATRTADGPVNIVEVGNARRSNARRTVIRYRPRFERAARVVAATIPGSTLQRGSTASNVDVAVLVGKRFTTEPLVQILPIPLPEPSEPPPECRR